MSLKGKTALVTGAAHGIGRAIAIELAREGAHIVAADLDGNLAEETALGEQKMGQRSLSIQCDVGVLKDIDRMVTQTIESFGRLDILVNNAGVGKHALDIYSPGYSPEGTVHEELPMILGTTEDEYDRLFRVNAKGTFFCMQRAAKEMITQSQGGRIINIASDGWKYHRYPSNSDGAYGAAKAAVVNMTKAAALQLGRHNINVNVVTPGSTKSHQYYHGLQQQAERLGVTIENLERQTAENIPTGRINEPEDIAYMVVFLAGPGARNITGQEFTVDGGLVMH